MKILAIQKKIQNLDKTSSQIQKDCGKKWAIIIQKDREGILDDKQTM